MIGRTHLIGGIAAGSALIFAGKALAPDISSSIPTYTLVMFCSALGGLTPDIDLPDSTIGRHLPIVSIPCNRIFGHRTALHSITLWAILLGLAGWRFPAAIPYIVGFGGGILSHLLLDMLNTSGVALLWPAKKRFSIANIPLESIGESIVSIFLVGVSIILWYYIFHT